MDLSDEELEQVNDGTYATDDDDLSNFYVFTRASEDIVQGDATGGFPKTSRAGNRYFLVIVYKNYVHAELLKSRAATEYVRAWRAAIAFFKDRGHSIKKVRIDNETSDDLEKYIKSDEHMQLECVTARDHRRNKAENVIRWWKNHFISVLMTAHPSFPLDLWDLLVEHALVQFNTLRPWGPNRKVSAYEGLHGAPFNFDRYPLGILGGLVSIHDGARKSWGAHAQLGYFVGHKRDGYREYRVHVTSTDTIRESDSIKWHPLSTLLPGSTGIEELNILIDGLAKVLKAILDKEISATQSEVFELEATKAIDSLRSITQIYTPIVDQIAGIPDTAATGLYRPRKWYPTFHPVMSQEELRSSPKRPSPQADPLEQQSTTTPTEMSTTRSSRLSLTSQTSKFG